MGKLEGQLDRKLVEAFKKIMAFALLIDLRKPFSDLEIKVEKYYTDNRKYTDEEIAKLKNEMIQLINQINGENNQNILSIIEQFKTEIQNDLSQFKIEIGDMMNELKIELNQSINDLNNKFENLNSYVDALANLLLDVMYKMIATRLEIFETIQDTLVLTPEQTTRLNTLKTQAKADLIALKNKIDRFTEGGEDDDDEDIDDTTAIDEIKIFYDKAVISVTEYCKEIFKVFKSSIIKEVTDYVDERLEGIEPNVDLCKELEELPQEATWGKEPRFLVYTPEGCKTVPVSPDGIFTDIRVFTSFSGNVIEGGTNTFQTLVRNVSRVPVGEIEVTLVLPETTEGSIIMGEELYSQPEGNTVSLVSVERNVRIYKITGLKGGDVAGISIPMTWNTKGSFQASALIKIIDSNVIDFDTKDDYSVSTCRVNAKTEGGGTEDCPLIECKIGDRYVPVVSGATNKNIHNALLEGRVGLVKAGDTIKFNVPVTFIPLNTTTAPIGVTIPTLGEHTYTIQYGYNSPTPLPEGIQLETVDSTTFRVVDNGDNRPGAVPITSIYLELRAGSQCKPQYVLFIIDSIERRLPITSVGVTDFKILQGVGLLTSGVEYKENVSFSTVTAKDVDREIVFPTSGIVRKADNVEISMQKNSKVTFLTNSTAYYIPSGGNIVMERETIGSNHLVTVTTNDLATNRDDITTPKGELKIKIIG